MKKLLVALMLCLPLIFAACSGDDDDVDVAQITDSNSIQLTVIPSNAEVELMVAGSKVAIDWGDGILDKYALKPGEPRVFKHFYDRSAPTYKIKVLVDDLTSFSFANGIGELTGEMLIPYTTKLTSFAISDHKDIETFKMENCPNLTYLRMSACPKLKSIDVSECPELVELSCYLNDLSSLDLKENKKLQRLYCNNNKIASLDLKDNPQMEFLDCNSNGMNTLSLKNCASLGLVRCENNNLITIGNLSDAKNLWALYCSANKLTSLNLSSLTKLETLYCYFNEIGTLNVNRNTELKILGCAANMLATLDVSQNKKMAGLYCGSNNLDAATLNKIFADLPDYKARQKDTNPSFTYDIQFKSNPGEAGCTPKTITDKGWSIVDKDISNFYENE